MGFFDFWKKDDLELKELDAEIAEIEKEIEKDEKIEKKRRTKKEDYKTVDDIHKEKQKFLSRSIIKLGIGSFLTLLVLSLIITVYNEISTPSRPKGISKEDIDFNVTKQNLWQLSTDRKIANLSEEIKDIKSDVRKELNNTLHTINNIVSSFQEDLNRSMTKINDKIAELDKNYKKNLLSLRESILSYVESQNLETKREFEKNLEQSIQNLKSQTISISKNAKILPIPKFDLNVSKSEHKNINNIEQNSPFKFSNQKDIDRKLEEKYANLDFEQVEKDMSVDYETIEKNRKLEENKTKKFPPFHIMTGFARATLITGVSANTFGEGLEHPKPVILSLDTPNIIANDDYEDLQDCMLIGEANGNLVNSRAEIKITRISCSAYDKKGKQVKLEFASDPIGWVIGEDGKYGLKGRLVDSAGKIIMRQIMVGFLQGVAMAFQPQQTTVFQNPLSPQSTQNSLQYGVSGGINTAFNSLAQYYKKMLDGMYPYIDVMAGRKVTVLFKGFQDVQFTPYRKVVINNVDLEDDGIQEDEIEIEENDYGQLGF